MNLLRRFRRLRLRCRLVADAPDRHDRGGVAELAPELTDVDVHGPRVAGERVAPHALEQLVTGQHEPLVVEELPEEVELLRGELHLHPVDRDLAAAGVDAEQAVLDHLALELAPLWRRAAQDRLDAGDELARVERLGQVVVCPDLEPDDLVDVLVAGGKHEDGDVRPLADAPADVDPVQVGEHEVEDDQRRRVRRGAGERVRAGGGDAHDVARVLQVHSHEGRDALLVLDEKDRLALRRRHGALASYRDRGLGQPPRTSDRNSTGHGLNGSPSNDAVPVPLSVTTPRPTRLASSPVPWMPTRQLWPALLKRSSSPR